MYRVTRRLEFDAAHRVPLHESKCRALHGHRYVAELTVEAESLDPAGRVVDFGDLKRLVGGWVDEKWDHTMILAQDDPLLPELSRLQKWANPDRPVFVLDGPPTAEVMARALYREASRILVGHPLHVVGVRLYETPNCWADWAGS